MEWMVLTFASLASAGLLAAAARRRPGERRAQALRRTRAAAEALGLRGRIEEEAGAFQLQGTLEGRAAWLRGDAERLVIGLPLDKRIPARLEVYPRASRPNARSWIALDRDFDRVMSTRGPPSALLALLGRPLRKGLIRANTGRTEGPYFGVEAGALVVHLPEWAVVTDVIRAKDTLLRLRSRVPQTHGHVAAGLLERVKDASEREELRSCALELLLGRAPDSAHADQARQAALQSGLPALTRQVRATGEEASGRLSLAPDCEHAGALSDVCLGDARPTDDSC